MGRSRPLTFGITKDDEMRKIAIGLNILLLITVAMIFINDLTATNSTFLLLFSIATPVFSIIALYATSSDSWLALYFKRKAAEERKRISELTK